MKKSTLIISMLMIIQVNLNGCQTTEKESPDPFILISIDGLRPDYLTRADTPVLDQLIQNGSLAEHLISIFPSKTFPNHYSTATGLYGENSGIVSNNMYDQFIGGRFTMSDRSAVEDARWYGGEPIWVTAENQGVRSGTVFWPGSEAPVNGTYATHWLKYDGRISHDARVDTLIRWYQLPDDKRPTFTTFYMSIVDDYGHRYGPYSDSIAVAMQEVDRTLGYLINELDRIGMWPNVNIVITSDHGMAEVSNEKVIVIDEIINLDDVEIYDWSPVAMIQPNDGKTEPVYQALKAAENNYTVYMKGDLPEAFRIKNHHRVPDVTVVAESGYTIITRARLEERGVSGGAHGYDPSDPEMKAFFLASGPAFKTGKVIPPFELVHIYELISIVLGLNPAPNDGDPEVLRPILN
jgi:predicted AlkP superfamily pyrophosphatase or phosphodiesterase